MSDVFSQFGKVRLRLDIEVEPPEYDEEDNQRMKRMGAEHKVTHKHTEVFQGSAIFTGLDVDMSDGLVLRELVLKLMREAFQKAADRVEDDAFTR